MKPFGLLGDTSGTSCTDESSMGLRLKYRGKTALSFAIWLTEVSEFYDLAIQEITHLFEESIFKKALPQDCMALSMETQD